MKRLHVHVAVEDLPRSINFYSALFASQPAVVKSDYAKWMLDDPRVNFAISTRGREPGLDHLGIQVENQNELHEVYARLKKAGGAVIEQGQTACCYAKSEKSWIDFTRPGAPQFDFVFTVCDNAAAEACPVWPGQPMTAHWGVPDPAEAKGTQEQIEHAFRDAYLLLERRISLFLSLPVASLDKLAIQKEIDRIGRH